MKRLRRREPFGKAGLTVAILALVLALVGGAYAAGGLTKSQEKQVKKIAKKYAGKPGANGTNGANGAPGEKGAAGAIGPTGNTGATGNSVKLINEAPTNCIEGGFTYEVEGSGHENEVCDGEEGSEGPEGALGTAGTTLPTNATETGTWSAAPNGVSPGDFVAIGFPIQLHSALAESKVHYVPAGDLNGTGTGTLTSGSATVGSLAITTGGFKIDAEISGAGIPAGTLIKACTPDCGAPTELELSVAATASGTGVSLTAAPPSACASGSVEVPKATSGNLCVYEDNSTGVSSVFGIFPPAGFPSSRGAGVSGAMLVLFLAHANEGEAFGSWAVTG